MLRRDNIKDILPLSPLQEGFFFHSKLDPRSKAYQIQESYTINTEIDPSLLKESIIDLTKHYDILRTLFIQKGSNKVLQIVLKEVDVNFQYKDVSDFENKERYINNFKEVDNNILFELEKAPLLRFSLLKMNSSCYEFILTYHHIIFDAWSVSLFLNEILNTYFKKLKSEEIRFNKALQYKLYIDWISGKDKQIAHNFWKGYLKGYSGLAELSVQTKLNTSGEYELAIQDIGIDHRINERINEIVKKFNITKNIFFQTVWGICLCKINSLNDIVFGTIVSGRPSELEEVDSMMGLFINSVPVRFNYEKNQSFSDLIRLQHRAFLNIIDHQYYPLSKIQKFADRKNNLFNHLFVFQNFPRFKSLSKGGEEISIEKSNVSDQTHYDFNLKVVSEEKTTVFAEFNNKVYDDIFISKILKYYLFIIEQVCENTNIKLGDIHLLKYSEIEEVSSRINTWYRQSDNSLSIPRILEEISVNNSDSIALADSQGYYTYGFINAKANQLANYLRKKGVKANVPVAIMSEQNVHSIIGILGILKSGAAYVPIDPKSPCDRINYILNDANVKYLLTSNQVYTPDNKQISIVNLFDSQIVKSIAASPALINKEDDVAYIIYTSGTTGMPKGVPIEHGQVIGLIKNESLPFDFDNSDIWTVAHSLAFDFSVWEIFGALFNASKMVMVNSTQSKDPQQLHNILVRENVTILNQTPTSFYNLLHEDIKSHIQIKGLKYIIFGGEALNPYKIRDWKTKYPECKLVNMFGITETTVHVTFKELFEEDLRIQNSNIGLPLSSHLIFLVNDDLNNLPEGVKGEILVGGKCVTRGYLNNPELTDERILRYQFGTDRLYKSGDLGVLLDNGEIEYLGRSDRQCNFRGYRIEPAEIEIQLLKNKKVKDVFVTTRINNVKERSETFLYAYYISNEKEISTELRNHLQSLVPSYMVPTYFIQVDIFPLNSNGKIDTEALPTGTNKRKCLDSDSKTESEKMEKIWESILDNSDIDIHDSFFSIGGDSILAIRLLAAIKNEFKKELKIMDLYYNDSIYSLLKKIDTVEEVESNNPFQKIENELFELQNSAVAKYNNSTNIESVYPLSDIQFGMIYHSILSKKYHSYKEQEVIPLKIKNFDPEIFKKALYLISEKHEILRTAIDIKSFDQYLQIVLKKPSISYIHEAIHDISQEEQFEILNNVLIKDIETDYKFNGKNILWRIKTFDFGNNKIVIVFSCHHTILDGWSTASLFTELNNVYVNLLKDENFKPEKLKNSYKQFVVEQLTQRKDNSLRDYWKKELSSFKEFIFPDALNKKQNIKEYKTTSLIIDSERFEEIKKFSANYQTSIKHVFFTAYCYMLYMISYEPDFIVGLTSTNRPICEDGDKILGCFLNNVPVKIKISPNKSWLDVVNQIHDKIIEITNYNSLSLFEINRLIDRSPKNPIYNTSFGYVDFHIYNDRNNESIQLLEEKQLGKSLGRASRDDVTLTFSVEKHSDHFIVAMTYDSSIISEDLIIQLNKYFTTIIENVIDHPDEKATKYQIFNKTFKNPPKISDVKEIEYDNICNAFYKQVSKSNDKIAVVFNDKQITYKELNIKANQLADYLLKIGISKGNSVGLYCDPDLDMLVAILAILKTGGHYLPIDVALPVKRIDYILRDNCTDVVLTNLKSGAVIDSCGVVYIPEVLNRSYNGANIEPKTLSSDLAYIIYTSGSTGYPKGVLVEQSGVLNLVQSLKDNILNNYHENLNIALLAPLHFDASVQQIFSALLSSGKLILTPTEIKRDGKRLANFLYEKNVEICDGTPHHINLLLESKSDIGKKLRKINHFVIGGDLFHKNLVKRLYEYKELKDIKISNVYGITECTVDSTIYTFGNEILKENNPIYIGKPIYNTGAYVLDVNYELQPPGIPGELYISGHGLARGYLNDIEKSMDSFINQIECKQSNIYKTGDFVYINTDGNINYIGRIDNQIKLRGHRIELSEIEYIVNQMEGIKQSAVILVTDEKEELKYLHLFYNSEREIDKADFYKYISSYLPKYMVPSKYTGVSEIPLTSNGKIDRKKLAETEVKISEYRNLSAPSCETQELVLNIWKKVLKNEEVGIDDNFFDIGGHSFNVMQLVKEINENLNQEVNLSEIFTYPTIRSFTDYIRKKFSDIQEASMAENVNQPRINRLSQRRKVINN